MKNGELVSVIITTKNEGKVIRRLLLSIKNQSYKWNEIIIVDNNSSDKTKEISREFTKYVYNFGPERSAQRNYGAKKAIGKYVVFLDADMKLSKNVLSECVDSINKDKKNGAIIIPEVSIASSFWEKVKAYERSFYNENGDETTDAARFFKINVFRKVHGYDESITGPEDWDLPERVRKSGYKIGRTKSVIYHFEKIKSLYTLIRKKFYYAKLAHIYMDKQKISVVSPKTIYFLRPVFYKNWRKLVTNPLMSIAMFYMFTMEMLGGGLGYLWGKYHE